MKMEALHYEKLQDKKVRCNLCAHRCTIQPDKYGICNVRQNIDGTLYSLVYGELIAASIDPIEKKPLYHLLPGSRSYSIATVGCNFQCGFCQNWQISQVSKSGLQQLTSNSVPPESVVEKAVQAGCKTIAFTYTEPTIFFEYALDVAKMARARDIHTIFVTNGFMSDEALTAIAPYLSAANVDLKSFSERFYSTICKASLNQVLKNIERMHNLGIWIEVTTLIVTGENDDPAEIRGIADFLAGISPDIPWHISRFHPDYKFNSYQPTPAVSMEQAWQTGKEAGLRHVYLGNVIADTDTICYKCGVVLVKRSGFSISIRDLDGGKCRKCGTSVAGIF